MLIQPTAGRLIGPDVLVDAFRTQLKPVGRLQSARNLLWTSLLAQRRVNLLDHRRRHLGHFRLLATTHQGVLMRLAGTIAALAAITA